MPHLIIPSIEYIYSRYIIVTHLSMFKNEYFAVEELRPTITKPPNQGPIKVQLYVLCRKCVLFLTV